MYSKKIIDQLIQFNETSTIDDPDSERLSSRLTIIPYRAVGQSSPFLVAIRPDCIKLFMEEGLIETSKVLIAIQDKELSSDQSFTSIIHPSLIQQEISREVKTS
nr:sigma-E processing peptidase SpoIIGA [Bacillus sp. JCM 19034]